MSFARTLARLSLGSAVAACLVSPSLAADKKADKAAEVP